MSINTRKNLNRGRFLTAWANVSCEAAYLIYFAFLSTWGQDREQSTEEDHFCLSFLCSLLACTTRSNEDGRFFLNSCFISLFPLFWLFFCCYVGLDSSRLRRD